MHCQSSIFLDKLHWIEEPKSLLSVSKLSDSRMFTCPTAGGMVQLPDIRWYSNGEAIDMQGPGFSSHPAYNIQNSNLIINITAIDLSAISVRCEVSDSTTTLTATTFMQLKSKIIDNAIISLNCRHF